MVKSLFESPRNENYNGQDLDLWNGLARYRDLAIIPDESLPDDTRLFALLRMEQAENANAKTFLRFQTSFDKRMKLDSRSMAARGRFIDARANILARIPEVFKGVFEVRDHIHINIDGQGFTNQAAFLQHAFAIDENGKIGKPAGMRGTEMMGTFKDADRLYAEAALAEDMTVMAMAAADLERLDIELADGRAKIDRVAGDPNWREKYIAAAETAEAMVHVVTPAARQGLKDELVKGANQKWTALKKSDPIKAWKTARRIAHSIGIKGMDAAWKAESQELANAIVHDKKQTKRAEFIKDNLNIATDARSYIVRAKPRAPKNGL